MSKTLVILESPGKIKKIEGILGSNYKAMASFGHIMDLDPKKMSIEIENNFNPIYIINPDKMKVVKDIKSQFSNAKDILIMTDLDREGAMIAWSIAHVLKLKAPKRVTFTSITKKDLLEAIKNPLPIDTNVVDAQKTRRMLDRLVGYELSPLLNKHVGQYKLSAGRVQSVVARLIVDRENEIKKFMSQPFKSHFKFKANFMSNNKEFTANLHDLEGVNAEGFYKGSSCKIDGEQNSRNFLENCNISIFKVEHVFNKKRTQGPSPPFTTSTLQQESSRKLGFPGKRTMACAQKLYEAGYITYMRTDSVNLSEEAMENIKKYVIDTYGNNYYRLVEYKSKSKNTQEAHEAIRPTDVFTTDTTNEIKLGPDEARLYSLIWKRTVASQMKPAEYDVTSIQISISKELKHFFMTTIENLTFEGFLTVYNINNINKEDNDDNDDVTINKGINIPKKGTILNVKNITGTQDYIRPVGRYNEASLTDKLDPKNLNIGRPATYVSIIGKILEREYVKIGDIDGKEVNSKILILEDKKINEENTKIVLGKEKGKYIPTPLGILVTYFLMINFPKIMDYKFTAEMEEKLDEIANGKLVWHKVLKEFYDEFHPQIEKISITTPLVNDKYTKLLGKHPKTGFDIYATMSKHGPVIKMITSNSKKPQFAGIDEPLTIETINLNDALKLLDYPKKIGKLDDNDIILNKGRYGLYLTCGTCRCNVEGDSITIEQAMQLINEKIEQTKINNNNTLASFSQGTKLYKVYKGPYGNYINVFDLKTKKKSNVSLPQNEDIDKLTLSRITDIISSNFKNKFEDKKVKKVNNNNKKTSIKKPAK